jgi:hypothetical protein
VAGIDVALERLHPVALALIDLHARVRQQGRLEIGQRRRRLARPEIGPDETSALDARVRDGSHLLLEAALGRLVGHVDAAAADVELPAVVDAPEAFHFVAAVEEARAPMRAALAHQPDGAGRRAKRDEVLAQEPHAQRSAVTVGQLARDGGRNPVLPHQLAHRRAAPDPAQELVVFSAQHVAFLSVEVDVAHPPSSSFA